MLRVEDDQRLLTLDTNLEFADSPSIKNSIFSRFLGVILLATFPLFGNWIAYLTGGPRRGLQLLGLALALTLLAFSQPSLMRDFFLRVLYLPKFRLSLFVLLIVNAILWTVRLIGFKESIETGRITDAIIVLLWQIFFLCLWQCREIYSETIAARPIHSNLVDSAVLKRNVLLPLTLLGLFYFSSAWYFGPAPGEVLMSFQGSPIYSGNAASILAFVLLFIFPGFLGALSSAPFIFLVVMSTARSALAISFILLLVYAMRTFYISAYKLKALQNLILPGVMFLLFILTPATLESRFYPYYLSQENAYKTLPRRSEYIRRYTRFLRIAPDFVVNFLWQTDIANDSVNSNFLHSVDYSLKDLFYSQSRESDARMVIYKKTLNSIERSPFGLWPKNFSETLRLDCGSRTPCDYPHNFFLEAGFYFGWGLMLFLLCGMFFLVPFILKDLVTSRDPFILMCAVVVSALCLQIQVSGNLFDSVIALAILWIWLVYKAQALPNLPK